MALNFSTFFDGNAFCPGNKTTLGVDKTDVIVKPALQLGLKFRSEAKIPLESCNSYALSTSDWLIAPPLNSGKFTLLGVKEFYAGMFLGDYVTLSGGLVDPIKARVMENAPGYFKDPTHTSWFSQPLVIKGPGPNPGLSVTVNFPSLVFGAPPIDNEPLSSRIYVSANHARKDSSFGITIKNGELSSVLPIGGIKEEDPFFHGSYLVLGGGVYPEYYGSKATFKGLADVALIRQSYNPSEEKEADWMFYSLAAADVVSKNVKISIGGEFSAGQGSKGLRGQVSAEPIVPWAHKFWKIVSFNPYLGGGFVLAPAEESEEVVEETPPSEGDPESGDDEGHTGVSTARTVPDNLETPAHWMGTVGSVGLRLNFKLNENFSGYLKSEKDYANDTRFDHSLEGFGIGGGLKVTF